MRDIVGVYYVRHRNSMNKTYCNDNNKNMKGRIINSQQNTFRIGI